jgi:serine/threonine protein kinase
MAGLDGRMSYTVKTACASTLGSAGVDDWGRPVAAPRDTRVRNTVQCECRILSRLPPHRNVTRFFTTFTDRLPPSLEEYFAETDREQSPRALQFVVLEWHPSTLAIHTHEPTPLPQLWRWARDVLRGQAFLRQHGAVHRDLTPAAVAIARDGRLVLCDLGYGVLLPQSLRVPLSRLAEPGGHPARLSPEVHAVWAGREATPGAVMDYSRQGEFETGVLLYELATGALPFGVPATGLPPALDDELAGSLLGRVMMGLVRLDPTARLDLREALELLSGE